MIKVVKQIDVPEEWESTSDWDSHRPILYVALEMLRPVIVVTEFGCGYGSTKLMDKWCKNNDAHFFSYETNYEWAKKFNNVVIMKDYDDIHLSEFPHRQNLLFIDSAPGEQRKDLIAKHANHADVIVVHDSEKSSSYVYGLEPVLSTFKYRLDYEPKGNPHTTCVSNFVNVCEWLP